MKRFIKCVCLLLAMSIMMAVPVCATENTNTRGSNFFAASSVYLEPIGGRGFQVWFDVTAVGMMDELGAKSITIQRSTDNANWTNISTYSKNTYTNLTCKNTGEHASYVTFYGSAGYYYRAYVELYAKDGNGTAIDGRYTSSIHF